MSCGEFCPQSVHFIIMGMNLAHVCQFYIAHVQASAILCHDLRSHLLSMKDPDFLMSLLTPPQDLLLTITSITATLIFLQ